MTFLRFMRFLASVLLGFARLVAQSVFLALSQIWANKVRAILTTLGIIIGVASVTAVIAALSGLKAKIMTDVETFGTNRIFIWSRWPDSGPKRRASWRAIRFLPSHFEGMLEHCPSVESLTKIETYGDSIKYRDRSIENARVHGIESAWHKIESRPVIMGRPFSAVDQLQGRLVCLVDPTLRDKLGLNKDPTGEIITIGHYSCRIIGVVDKRPSMSMIGGGGRGEEYEVFVPFNTLMNIMLVSVSERTHEIGLRKAVGAKASSIMTQFLIEAVVLCCVGGLFGVAAGQGLTMIIARIPKVSLDQAYIPYWAILMSFGFSAAVGVFFGMFPAVKAARLDPIEALRHE